MKLSFIIIVVTILHASASAYSQEISLNMEKASIPQVLREIQKQTDYDFVFKSELFNKTDRITISQSNISLNKALEEIIPAGLEYEIVGKTIVIRKRKIVRTDEIIIVEGRVVDEDGMGIPGATVQIDGTELGVVTDADGIFRISIPDGYKTLVIQFVGYKRKVIEIDRDNKAPILVQMEVEVTSLSEVVITGFFLAEKESYTGTAKTVEGVELMDMGGASLLDNLSLVAPQVLTVQNNALGSNPNAVPEIRIRGESVLGTNLSQSSLLGDPNLPLFILDNFPVEVQRVIDLDQTRIESVSVLIDASATAIYGSRAANGVIIIKTKQPEAGKLQTSYNFQLDLDIVDVESYDLLSGPELFELQSRLGMRKQVLTAGYETREIERLLAAGVNTDWLAQPVQNAIGQRHNINLQGGTDEIRYSIDGNYINRPGVMKGSKRDTYGAVMRLIYNPTERLTFRNSMETNFNEASESPYGSFDYYARIPGYLPINNLNGSFTHRYDYSVSDDAVFYFTDDANEFFYNPIFEAQVGNIDRSSYTNFINNFEIIWDINDNLRFQSNISYTRQNDLSEVFRSPFSIDFIRSQNPEENGTYDRIATDMRRLNSNATFSYTRDFSGHIITSNLGFTLEENVAERFGFSTFGYSTNNPDPAFSLGYEKDGFPLSVEETQRFVQGFVTLNYNYKGRYLIDGSFNRSGNSSAGASKRFAPFWSIGVGWNMHNEDFIPKDIISQLRLTASYGVTGSIQFSSYQALTTSSYYSNYRYLGGVGSYLLGIGNDDLRWQLQAETNIGLSFGLFKNRLTGQAAFYVRNTTDVVTTIDAPPSLGFDSFTENLGEIENKGFEFNTRVHIMKRSDWDVFLSASIQQNKSRLLSIGNALDSYNDEASRAGLTPEQYAEAVNNDGFYTIYDPETDSFTQSQINLATLSQDFVVRYEEGGSNNDIYVARSLGIDPMTGQEFYLTADGEATTDYFRAEIVKAGNTNPEFWGTFGPIIRYKGFNMQALFTYQYGAQTLNQTLINKVENSDKYGNVDRRVLTQGWFEPGDVVPFKSNVTIDGNQVRQGFTYPSTRFVQDNNFIQFSTLNLTYDAPKGFINKLKLQSVRLSLVLNNIFYSSSVRQERGTAFPFSRSMTFGLRVGI